MKHLNRLVNVWVILFVSLAVSCARVPIKNSEWCGDLAEEGATCFNTHNDKTRDLDKDSWDKERKGMFCTKSDNFAEWQAIILKLCRASGNRCSYEDKKKIVSFFGKAKDFSDEQYAFSLELMEKNIQLDQDLKQIEREIEEVEQRLDEEGTTLM